MARVGVNYNEIAEVAESLLINGENPTIEKVRINLGGRGSNSTISKYLNEWRSISLPKQLNRNAAQLVPPDPVNRAVSAVWQQIQEEKEVAINNVKQELEEKIKSLTKDNQKLTQELDATLAKHNEVAADLLKVTNELDVAKIRVEQEVQAHTITKAMLEALKHNFAIWQQDKEKDLLRIEQANAQALCMLEAKYLDAINKSQQESNATKAAMETARHKHILENDKLKIDKAKLEQSLANFTTFKQSLQRENEKLVSEFIATRKLMEKLESMHIELFEQHKEFSSSLALNNSNVHGLQSKVQGIYEKLALCTGTQAEYDKVFMGLSSEILAIKQELRRITQTLEKNFLCKMNNNA